MNNLDQELKQFISSYRRENHDQAKQQADILFKKYSSEIKLFKTVGMLFLQNNKLEDAITVFRKIIKLYERCKIKETSQMLPNFNQSLFQ